MLVLLHVLISFDSMSFVLMSITPRLEPIRDAISRAQLERGGTKDVEAGGRRAPVVAVHIRRGDKYVESATIGDDVFARALGDIAARHAVAGLLIASDDAAAAARLAAAAAENNVTVLNPASLDEDTRHSGPNSKARESLYACIRVVCHCVCVYVSGLYDMRDHVFISDRLCRSPPLSLSCPLNRHPWKDGKRTDSR